MEKVCGERYEAHQGNFAKLLVAVVEKARHGAKTHFPHPLILSGITAFVGMVDFREDGDCMMLMRSRGSGMLFQQEHHVKKTRLSLPALQPTSFLAGLHERTRLDHILPCQHATAHIQGIALFPGPETCTRTCSSGHPLRKCRCCAQLLASTALQLWLLSWLVLRETTPTSRATVTPSGGEGSTWLLSSRDALCRPCSQW